MPIVANNIKNKKVVKSLIIMSFSWRREYSLLPKRRVYQIYLR